MAGPFTNSAHCVRTSAPCSVVPCLRNKHANPMLCAQLKEASTPQIMPLHASYSHAGAHEGVCALLHTNFGAQAVQATVLWDFRSSCRIHCFPEGSQRIEHLWFCAQVRIVASMPCYSEANVNEQRGRGVFERSISGLRALNAAGYGQPGTGLTLDLVYNPNGAFLAPPTATLQVGLPPIYEIPHCTSEHIYC